jgi:hypothetical protein
MERVCITDLDNSELLEIFKSTSNMDEHSSFVDAMIERVRGELDGFAAFSEAFQKKSIDSFEKNYFQLMMSLAEDWQILAAWMFLGRVIQDSSARIPRENMFKCIDNDKLHERAKRILAFRPSGFPKTPRASIRIFFHRTEAS